MPADVDPMTAILEQGETAVRNLTHASSALPADVRPFADAGGKHLSNAAGAYRRAEIEARRIAGNPELHPDLKPNLIGRQVEEARQAAKRAIAEADGALATAERMAAHAAVPTLTDQGAIAEAREQVKLRLSRPGVRVTDVSHLAERSREYAAVLSSDWGAALLNSLGLEDAHGAVRTVAAHRHGKTADLKPWRAAQARIASGVLAGINGIQTGRELNQHGRQ